MAIKKNDRLKNVDVKSIKFIVKKVGVSLSISDMNGMRALLGGWMTARRTIVLCVTVFSIS